MRLKSLRLHGFKSFADRTTLEFREGVTAIIGSNGCGKSNIADSVRWVLGEQRASAIRGAKMEEVIFQGTTRRRPLNLAEVSLLFDNDRGRVAVPQSEIEVTRRVFREGGSEYLLNRNGCRLRDIHNLLRDTGLGSNAYAIIEAGMIETLLSDRAEERRALFEEAAGIGRYKDSRQAASRRLAAAETDLARLQDLLAEVEAKVRSLSRQKRRAERHKELQARRLDLEVAATRTELATLEAELADAERRHAELDAVERASGAERSAAELRTEEQRAEAVHLTHRRTEAAVRLEQVRSRLDAREREVLVADERRSHAELRLQELVRERSELEQRSAALDAERTRMESDRARQRGLLDTLAEQVEAHAEENRVVRSALAAERASAEAAAGRARDLAREIAAAEGDRASTERRRREAEERSAELRAQEQRLGQELEELAAQTELFSGRVDEVRARLDAAVEEADTAREEIRALRSRDQSVRDALGRAEDRLSRLASQVDAREALERSYEGFSPAVAAVMASLSRFAGVHGPLADFVGGDAARQDPQAVEAYLGPLLQALVVEDLAAARGVRRWFRDEWKGGGSLLLLPLDAPAVREAMDGGAVPGGRHWAETLLGELVVLAGDALDGHESGAPRVGADGDVVDARGVVRLVQGGAGEGILARREALTRLRAERHEAEVERDARARERAELRQMLEAAEERAQEAEELRRLAESELKRVEMDSAAHNHRNGRLLQDRAQVGQTLASLEEAARDAEQRLSSLQDRLAELARSLEAAGAEEQLARGRLGELELRWEDAREEESGLRVEVARLEAELRETERRHAAAEHGIAAAARRRQAIEQEAATLRGTLEGLSGVRDQAGDEIRSLFEARDREAAVVAQLDARLAELESGLAALAEAVRVSRRRESEAGEARHQLELRTAELRSRKERAAERLEVEWGRPWEVLLAEATPVTEGGLEEWRAELAEAARQLDALGPVNMLAMEEFAEEETRLNFLLAQRDDLVNARDDLVAAIRQINRTAREVFMETFGAVRENFQRVFQSLFQGGECDVWLADPDDPLESPVEIQASPKGKRTQRIHLLSGGERTLTALALLFALYLVKPSPFCVLDEVDAPLDESNVGRFIQLLQDFKADTQFVVITHNPRTMEAADWVYGVTMEEPGVSSIVGVELLGAWAREGHVAVST